MLSSTVSGSFSVGGSSGAERLAIGDGLLGYGLELALISVHVYEAILTVYDTILSQYFIVVDSARQS